MTRRKKRLDLSLSSETTSSLQRLGVESGGIIRKVIEEGLKAFGISLSSSEKDEDDSSMNGDES